MTTIGGSAAILALHLEGNPDLQKLLKQPKDESHMDLLGVGCCSRVEVMQQGTHTSWVLVGDII